MNYILWLVNDKQELSQILDIVSLFYKLTNIKVKPTKSILATNTKKQIIYIINAVILTRLSYRILNIFLNLTTMRKITNKYTDITKHKAGLASSVSNSILHYHKLYSFKTVEDL